MLSHVYAGIIEQIACYHSPIMTGLGSHILASDTTALQADRQPTWLQGHARHGDLCLYNVGKIPLGFINMNTVHKFRPQPYQDQNIDEFGR